MNSKKTYIKPQIETFKVDNSISLVMASESGPPGPDLPPVANQSEPLQQNNFESNPFDETK